jgi:hypothetical protein
MTNDNIPAPAWLCLDCQLTGGGASLCRAVDGSHTFELLARAYLSEDEDHRHRAIDCVGELVQAAPAAAVGFLIVACAQCTSIAELCVIAAGPLEDLLEAHGPVVISHLETVAKVDPRFRLMVSGTWGQDRVDPDVWGRLTAAVAPGPVVEADPRSPAGGFSGKVATAGEIAALFAPVPPVGRQH